MPCLPGGAASALGPFKGLNGSVTTGDDLATVRRNRRAVAEAIGLPLIWAKPVHGTETVFIDRAFAAGAPRGRRECSAAARPIASDRGRCDGD